MYAIRLGTGFGVEPGEDRPGPARRRVDYSIVRALRAPGAAAEAARDTGRAEHVPGPARARNGAARASRDRPRQARRWRRIVRNAVLAGLVLVAVGLAAARSVEGSAPPAQQTVMVQRGDTIWSLASRHYPDSDPRSRVDQIERLNHLDGPDVRPGERIQLPAD
jgi:LysM repeat protein